MSTTEIQTLSFGRTNISPTSVPSTTDTPTYFSKSEIQYLPLTENGDIETAGFVKACNGIVEFVGFLGSAFTPVKNDINGNIGKVDRVYQTDPQKYATIKKLLESEIIDWPNRMGPATESLLWLKRALEFVSIFLDLIVIDYHSGKKSNTLVPMGKEAYKRSLKGHHKMGERALFKGIIHLTPYRKDLLKTISAGRSHVEDKCIGDIALYLELMKPNVARLVEMYKEMGLEK